MTLTISSNLSQTGTSGANGAAGANGVSAAHDGSNGSAGGAGAAAVLAVSNQSFIGDAGRDTISFTRTVNGGAGGFGGQGGAGFPAEATQTNSSGPGFSRADTFWDAAGNGGLGGLAGAGGVGRVVYDMLDFDLGGSAAGQNLVNLSGSATGGRGGAGGGSRGGGNSGSTTNFVSTTTSGSTSFSSITASSGTPGGLSPDGQDGAGGRLGTLDFTGISVIGDSARVTLSGTALGGGSGSGAAGATGRTGSVGSDGGSGGNGGDGGYGIATVSGLDINVTGGLNVLVNLWGRGGAGATGGTGGNAGGGVVADSHSTNGAGAFVSTTTYATAGAGGDGGDGGRGTAQMRDSAITGSAAVDMVEVVLRATGGNGNSGGSGGLGVASSSTTTGSTFTQTFNVVGTDAGAAGAAGVAGKATVAMTGNTILLDAGNDGLTLRLTADGPGARVVTLSGNIFDGGTGVDGILVGAQTATDRSVIFDVAGNRLRVGNSDWNTMTGFESFSGGSANDRFLDGTGDQTYRGFLGADRFEFRGGLAGADSITGFASDDIIRLRGFGTGLDSFAEVLAAASDTAQGVLIQTGATGSILLVGMTEAQLTTDDFLF